MIKLMKLNKVLKDYAHKYAEYNKNLIALTAIKGSEDSSHEIMKKCKEISTHFLCKNKVVMKECVYIAHNFALYGNTLEEIIESLNKFDLLRVELCKLWEYWPRKGDYGFEFSVFAFEKIKLLNSLNEKL